MGDTMTIADRLDDYGKPAWIALTVVSFMMFWPFGFAVLGYLIGSGRMGCWAGHHGAEHWQARMDRMQQRMQEKMNRMQERMQGRGGPSWCGPGRSGWGNSGSSGNRAFDEYRAETLRRLEEEQREFIEFLDRLRHAKDKAEFDQFMAERRNRPEPPPEAHPGA
jgi:hypothetical protein